MIEKNIRTIRWITFFALLSMAAAFLFPLVEWNTSTAFIGTLLVLIAAALVTWALETWLRFLLSQFGTGKKEKEFPSEKVGSQESNLLLSATQALLSAHSQKEVIEIVMRSGVALLSADGASFLGFEEWSSPPQIDTYGVAPHLTEGKWSGRLLSPASRQTCRSCSIRESGEECELFEGVIVPPSRVMCQPLFDGQREIGVINFHFNTPVVITVEQKNILNGLANNGSVVLSAIRKRDLETIAYRDVQFSPSDKTLNEKLTDLCNGIKDALEIESVVLWFMGDEAGDQCSSNIYFDAGSSLKKNNWTIDLIQKFRSIANESSDNFAQDFNPPELNGKRIFTFAYPFLWQQSKLTGLIILVNEKPIELSFQQLKLLKIVTKESSLFIKTLNEMDRLELKAVGEERIRLAREIHDGLAQTLAYLKFQSAQMLTQLSSGKFDKLESSLSANYQTISEAYQDARYAIDNLRSMPDGDINKWLLAQASNFTEVTGIPVDAAGLFIDAEIPLLAQVQLVRIVQEAFSNIRKHANASKVVLSGSESADEIVIEITDNGTGFEPDMVEDASKYGLVGMRERMDLIGGEFQIISKIGEGTRVRLAILKKVRVL
jgi:two-component system, NarL family, nitrate/nitrite sensor histidine kinase NarX